MNGWTLLALFEAALLVALLVRAWRVDDELAEAVAGRYRAERNARDAQASCREAQRRYESLAAHPSRHDRGDR